MSASAVAACPYVAGRWGAAGGGDGAPEAGAAGAPGLRRGRRHSYRPVHGVGGEFHGGDTLAVADPGVPRPPSVLVREDQRDDAVEAEFGIVKEPTIGSR